MNDKMKAIEQWTDEKSKEYLDMQYPKERIEWIVLDKAGLYGFTDSSGTIMAIADDDDSRTIGITQFLIRNGGSYISNT
jgi:hypothetical protein